MVYVNPTTAHERALRIPYYTLYWISTVSVFVLVCVILKARLRRHAVFYSLFISVILNGIANLVQIKSSANPPKALSVISAAGSTAFTNSNAGTAMALVLKTFSIIAFPTWQTHTFVRAVDTICLVIPWATTVIIFIGVAVSTAVREDNLEVMAYITQARRPIDLIAPQVVVLIFVALCIILEFGTVFLLIRRRRDLAHVDAVSNGMDDLPSARSPFDRSFTARVLIFGVWIIGGMGVATDFIVNGTTISSMYQATAGLTVFLVFGTQRDILEYLRILKPRHPSAASSAVIPLGSSRDLAASGASSRVFRQTDLPTSGSDLLNVDVERGLKAEEYDEKEVGFEAMLGGQRLSPRSPSGFELVEDGRMAEPEREIVRGVS